MNQLHAGTVLYTKRDTRLSVLQRSAYLGECPRLLARRISKIVFGSVKNTPELLVFNALFLLRGKSAWRSRNFKKLYAMPLFFSKKKNIPSIPEKCTIMM